MRRGWTLFVAVFLAASLPLTQAHAFIFLLWALSKDKPYKPPPLVEIPAPPNEPPIRQTPLPAPLLTKPIVKPMPPPMQLAQSNADVMRRLDQLEEENRRLREQVQRGVGAAPRSGLPSSPLPSQSAPGWWVHLYGYNQNGEITGEPQATYRYDPQKFNASVGFKDRRHGYTTELYLYRYEAWLVVQESGSYQIGAEVTCPWEHPCNLRMRIDGIEVVTITRKTLSPQMVFASRSLTPGSYRIEIIFGLANTGYINYSPENVTLYPKVRTPSDMNFRDFREGELVIPDRRDVPYGPPFQ